MIIRKYTHVRAWFLINKLCCYHKSFFYLRLVHYRAIFNSKSIRIRNVRLTAWSYRKKENYRSITTGDLNSRERKIPLKRVSRLYKTDMYGKPYKQKTSSRHESNHHTEYFPYHHIEPTTTLAEENHLLLPPHTSSLTAITNIYWLNRNPHHHHQTPPSTPSPISSTPTKIPNPNPSTTLLTITSPTTLNPHLQNLNPQPYSKPKQSPTHHPQNPLIHPPPKKKKTISPQPSIHRIKKLHLQHVLTLQLNPSIPAPAAKQTSGSQYPRR